MTDLASDFFISDGKGGQYKVGVITAVNDDGTYSVEMDMDGLHKLIEVCPHLRNNVPPHLYKIMTESDDDIRG